MPTLVPWKRMHSPTDTKRLAVFPGSFDPIHLGHLDILKRASHLFDRVIVAIGHNTTKTGLFPDAKRMQMAEAAIAGLPNVSAERFDGLTAAFCRRKGAQYLLRGLRNPSDADYELPIAHMNAQLTPGLETVFLLTAPEYSMLRSTIVREIHRSGGDIRQWVPWA